MSPVIGFICTSCPETWFDLSPINYRRSLGGRIINCLGSRCPRCGAIGRIPDGQYDRNGILLFNPADAARIYGGLQTLAARVESEPEAKAPEIVTEAARTTPVLSGLLKYAPKNFKELMSWLATLLKLFAALTSGDGDTTYITNQIQIYIEQSQPAPAGPRSDEPSGPATPPIVNI